MTLEEEYDRVRAISGDAFAPHCELIRDMASKVDHVVEFGTGLLVSTTAILAGQPRTFTTYDVNPHDGVPGLYEMRGRTDFKQVVQNDLEIEPVSCDMLFIDTNHTGEQLFAELTRHADGVRKWIVMHDTEGFATWDGYFGKPGLWPGLWKFSRVHECWRFAHVTRESWGLTVLERWAPRLK